MAARCAGTQLGNSEPRVAVAIGNDGERGIVIASSFANIGNYNLLKKRSSSMTFSIKARFAAGQWMTWAGLHL